MKKATEKIKRLPIIFPIDIQAFAETESEGGIPTEIHVLPVGKWNHPAYGPITIDREDISVFKDNFDNGLRKGIPITEGHDNGFSGELPAIGWFTELIDRGANGLYATIEWTTKGKTLLSEKAFKYFSPEFYSEYEDPETRAIHENVLVGGALTNKPYFKELEAVVLSEHSINNQFNFNDMNLQDILAKKVEELSAEEKTFLQENKEQLTDEQKTTFATVLEVEETAEEKETREKEEGDANEAKGLNRDGSTKELTDEEKAANVEAGKNEDGTEKAPEGGDAGGEEGGQQNASEGVVIKNGLVQMSQGAYKTLEKKANDGYEAAEKLRESEIRSDTSKLVFSEQNSKGRFLPAQSEKVFSFMKALSEGQRKIFAELVNTIPEAGMFTEVGHGGNADGTAFAEIETKAKKLMSDNKAITYTDAVKRVCEENPSLANRYETEK